MTQSPATTAELYKECFSNLAEKNCIFYSILEVLEIVAGSQHGIGEVVRDYALQAHGQLKNIILAGKKLLNATASEEDMQVLHNASYVLKTISRFLELLPSAMRRNKADQIGKEKLSLRDIEKISYVFSHSSQVQLLMVVPGDGAIVHKTA
jgi:hypothetical protein